MTTLQSLELHQPERHTVLTSPSHVEHLWNGMEDGKPTDHCTMPATKLKKRYLRIFSRFKISQMAVDP